MQFCWWNFSDLSRLLELRFFRLHVAFCRRKFPAFFRTCTDYSRRNVALAIGCKSSSDFRCIFDPWTKHGSVWRANLGSAFDIFPVNPGCWIRSYAISMVVRLYRIFCHGSSYCNTIGHFACHRLFKSVYARPNVSIAQCTSAPPEGCD